MDSKKNLATPGHGWMPAIAGREPPLYRAITDSIAEAVASGALPAGSRLPTHRAVAEALGIDLTTVTRAYAEARSRGLVEATVGRGTFVRGAAPPRRSAADGIVDLTMNLPPQLTEPSVAGLIQRDVPTLLGEADPQDLLTYRTGAGTRAEREAGAALLRPTLGEVDPDRILVCPGAQTALALLLRAMTSPGDAVLADAHTYPGLRAAAAECGVRLVAVAGDSDGMLPDAVAAACQATGARVLYAIPTLHNPTAVTMPPARREALAAVVQRHGLRVIEDDAYGLLPSAPLPALAALAPAQVFHVATLSKILSPALRVAFLVAPDAAAARRLGASLRALVQMASPLLTALAATWIRDGTAGAVRDAIRRECAARQAMARSLLPEGSFAAHPEGLHLWLRLPAPWDRLDFAAFLRREGLAVVPSDAFAIDPAAAPSGAVRLALGAVPDREALRAALKAVAAALAAGPRLSFETVV